uniref:Complex 1 LYR protein domain-containing protein n=1 Tax=Trypanosoma congolense (strain IL3000) TaxID=1068625 RepID=G0UY54_TRYCI|nr:conserved hypothetical protein [Trypanosoma congolense IL3000]
MLRYSRRLLHKVNDKGWNTHNFAFDTMTKVYLDAVYAGSATGPGAAPLPRQTSDTTPLTSSAAAVPNNQVQQPKRQGPRRSGVQNEILQLYRELLRETRRLNDPQTQVCLRRFIRSEFDRNIAIPRKFVTRIEWQIHYGKNKLEELRSMGPDSRFSLMC